MPVDRIKWDNLCRRVNDTARRFDPAGTRAWHARELAAQRERGPLAWCDESFWHNRTFVWRYHFPHVSARDATMIAYTVNDDKGERDIQTPIKPGRYLKQFFGNVLTEKQIKYYTEWHLTGTRPANTWDGYELKFATTSDEILHAYRHGVYSCMVLDHDRADHPVRAWGAGDVHLAYLEGDAPAGRRNKEHRIVARVLVRPATLVAAHFYPQDCYWEQDGFASATDSRDARDALKKKLRELGYKFAEEGHSKLFAGAKLLKIPQKEHYEGDSLPSIDSSNGRRDAGAFYELT